jgi:hypothetical protein
MRVYSSFIVILQLFYIIKCDESTDLDVYTIEHSIDTSDFQEIGSLNLRTIRQNQNVAQYKIQNEQDYSGQQVEQIKPAVLFPTLVRSDNFELNVAKQIKSLINNNETFYRIRLCRKFPTNICYASSFTLLKRVIESKMSINLTIYSNLNNRVSAISIKTSSNIDSSSKSGENFDHLNIYASVQSMRQAISPDTEAYLDKIRKEMEQKEKAAQGGNESFFSKYWMYIVPFVVIILLSNMVNPEAAGDAGAAR